LAGKNANGVLYNNIGAAIPTGPDTARVTAEFKKHYGAPGYFAVISYADVIIYGYCVKQVGDPTNRLAIGRCIGSLDMMTPAGRLVFDQKTHVAIEGDKYMPIQFFQIWNGKPVEVSPPQYSTAPMRMPPWIKKT
jgi:branched-chain amino acid transport system substrate-binding protein